MGNLIYALGAGTVITLAFFGLWRGALSERDQARGELKSAKERIESTESLVRDWAYKYDELNDKYLEAAIQGAIAAERESSANSVARTATTRLASLRQAESPPSEPCSNRVIRTADSQRLRNDESSRIVVAIAGQSAADAALDPIRLAAGPGTVLSGSGD